MEKRQTEKNGGEDKEKRRKWTWKNNRDCEQRCKREKWDKKREKKQKKKQKNLNRKKKTTKNKRKKNKEKNNQEEQRERIGKNPG